MYVVFKENQSVIGMAQCDGFITKNVSLCLTFEYSSPHLYSVQ